MFKGMRLSGSKSTQFKTPGFASRTCFFVDSRNQIADHSTADLAQTGSVPIDNRSLPVGFLQEKIP
jgi:hypothetical protein